MGNNSIRSEKSYQNSNMINDDIMLINSEISQGVYSNHSQAQFDNKERFGDVCLKNIYYFLASVIIAFITIQLQLFCKNSSIENFSCDKIFEASLLVSIVSLFIIFLNYIFIGPKHKLDYQIDKKTSNFKIPLYGLKRSEHLCKFICRISILIIIIISIIPMVDYANSINQSLININNVIETLSKNYNLKQDHSTNNLSSNLKHAIQEFDDNDKIDIVCSVLSQSVQNENVLVDNPSNYDEIKSKQDHVVWNILKNMNVEFKTSKTLEIIEQDFSKNDQLKQSITNIDDELQLTFKGTETIQDVIIDINLIPIESCSFNSTKCANNNDKIYIHGGFQNSIKNSNKKIDKFLDEKQKDYEKINYCGHSLGGASALIAGQFQIIKEKSNPLYANSNRLNRISTVAAPNVFYNKNNLKQDEFFNLHPVLNDLKDKHVNYAFRNDVVPNIFSNKFDMKKFKGDFDEIFQQTMWFNKCEDKITCLQLNSQYQQMNMFDDKKIVSGFLSGMIGEFSEMASKQQTINNYQMDPKFAVDQTLKNIQDPNLHSCVMYIINVWIIKNKMDDHFKDKLHGNQLLSPLIDKQFIERMDIKKYQTVEIQS